MLAKLFVKQHYAELFPQWTHKTTWSIVNYYSSHGESIVALNHCLSYDCNYCGCFSLYLCVMCWSCSFVFCLYLIVQLRETGNREAERRGVMWDSNRGRMQRGQ